MAIVQKPTQKVNQPVHIQSHLQTQKMSVVTVISVMVMNINTRAIRKSANNFTIHRVTIIIFIKTVSIRVVPLIVIPPTPDIPTVIFPAEVPVTIVFIIIFSIEISTDMIVIHASRTVFIRPVFITSAIAIIGNISPVVTIMSIKTPVINTTIT